MINESTNKETTVKPLLNIEQQIDYMKKKGITFNYTKESEAKKYLSLNNYYFRISSYRKNYYSRKENNLLKYVDLDFAYLKDLSIIDSQLRSLVVIMCLDIEFYTKIEIMRLIETYNEDGYSIVEDYFHSLSKKQHKILKQELERSGSSNYTHDLYKHYNLQLNNDFDYIKVPVWVFLEIISFGSLISFYKFCAERFNSKELLDKHYLLKSCKSLRNAAAHNSCILNDLSSGNAKIKANVIVSRKLSDLENISRNARKKKMSNIRIQEIVTLFISYHLFVTSEGLKEKTQNKMMLFSDRMFKNIDYYKTNNLIYSTFIFLKTVIDDWNLLV